jgi:outer membrane protease
MRRFLVLWLSAVALTAQAQDWELGVRYWLSTGMSERSHNAQGAAPGLGNPTSVLTYERLDAHALELHARKRFGERWFVRGNAGLGWIRNGSLDDEDFLAGQRKFSDSTSTVKGNRLSYASIDVGRDFWALRGGRTTIGLFAGYHHWAERLDAYGASFSVNLLGNADVGESVPVITNEVTWRALRFGMAASWRFNPKLRLALDVALVPYAEVRDDDSHYLRTAPSDLGPTPNIIMEGHGSGVQLDLDLRYALRDAWEIGAGLRHWWLRATSGSRQAAGTNLPLNELESQRTGLTLSVSKRW